MNWRHIVIVGIASSFVFGEIKEAGYNDIDKKHNHNEPYSAFQYNLTPLVMSTSGDAVAY